MRPYLRARPHDVRQGAAAVVQGMSDCVLSGCSTSGPPSMIETRTALPAQQGSNRRLRRCCFEKGGARRHIVPASNAFPRKPRVRFIAYSCMLQCGELVR